jgi:hypothetical protein
VNSIAADQPRIITFLDKHGMEIGVETEPDVINPPETVYELPGVVGDILRSQEWIRHPPSKI